MPKLFSYVVEHDDGFAPNPSGGLCTLAKCKYGKKRRNIVEIAEEGDWIIGTGGANPNRSAGHGKLIYAMRVEEKITLAEYFRRYEGKRLDADDDCPKRGRYALLSGHFCYFGQNAIAIPGHLLTLEKDGQNFKSNFEEKFVEAVMDWLNTLPRGENGNPCMTYTPRVEDKICGGCKPAPKRKKARAC